MATPYENAGGLLGPLGTDPEELKKLMAQIAAVSQQFGPSEADRSAANNQALINFGLAMMGTRKGQEWPTLGNAGFVALDARDRSLAGAQAGKKAQMAEALQAMSLLGQVQKQQEERKSDSVLAQFMQQSPSSIAAPLSGSVGGGMSPPLAPAVPPGLDALNAVPPNERAAVLTDMKMRGGPSPTFNGLPLSAPAPNMPPPVAAPAPPSAYERMMALSKMYAAAGMPKRAMQAEVEAQKHLPKYDKTPRTGTDAQGNPITYVVDEQGGVKVLPVGPEVANAHWVDTGSAWLPLHPKTLAPMGAPIPKTATIGEQMADTRAREAAARAAAAEDKPQWDSASGQWISRPSSTSPTGAAVTPTGFTKPEKDLTETQGKATAFINQMGGATQVIDQLKKKGFTGESTWQQADLARAGAEGIPYVPGSAMVQRMAASDDAQKYQQAELQWTEAALRFMTGANAPKEEVQRNADTYFPRPGDSAARVAQKAAARANMEQSIRLAAGRGAAKVPQRQGTAADPLGLR